jgi:uncharacterized protein YbaA (DUF1428 family)
MSYVDGFVVPLPEGNLKQYRTISQKAGKIFKEHGASFKKVIKPKPGETILFSFIVYKSRAERDKVNGKVMSDPRMKKMMESGEMPFDVKRMLYGGFKSLIDM